MAEDDLDAFFDEVSAAEAEAKEEGEEEKEVEEKEVKPPPAKKPKTTRGVVVAASSSKTTTTDRSEIEILNALAEASNAVAARGSNAVPRSAYEVVGPQQHHHQQQPQQQHQLQQQHQMNQVGPLPENRTKKAHKRAAAGKVWTDATLADWPDDDYRLWVGNLSKDVTDPQLYEHFAKYPSLQMVKVIRDPKGISKGYGFVSLKEPMDCARSIREMDQTWLASRPIRVKRSDWKERELKTVQKKRKKNLKANNKRFL